MLATHESPVLGPTPTVQAYESPVLQLAHAQEIDESEVAWFAAIGWVLLMYGSAWAWCKAVCGWRGVQSCSQTWYGQVKAVCK